MYEFPEIDEDLVFSPLFLLVVAMVMLFGSLMWNLFRPLRLAKRRRRRDRDIGVGVGVGVGVNASGERVLTLDAHRQERLGGGSGTHGPDDSSEADVIDILKVLNAEIYQTAVFVVERFESLAERRRTTEGRVGDGRAAAAAATTTKILGTRMAELLASAGETDASSLLLQAALQHGMCAFCQWVVFLKDPTRQPLANVTRQMKEAETRILRDTKIAPAHAELIVHFLDIFVSVLQTSGFHATTHQSIAAELEDHTHIILRKILELKKAIWEEVRVCDLSLVAFQQDARFDPDVMEDEYECGEDCADRVLCTTALGLKREGGKLGEGLLVKAHVLREAAIRED